MSHSEQPDDQADADLALLTELVEQRAAAWRGLVSDEKIDALSDELVALLYSHPDFQELAAGLLAEARRRKPPEHGSGTVVKDGVEEVAATPKAGGEK